MMDLFTTFHQLRRIRQNQWLDRVELEKIQREKLKRLVKYAYENVRYYRRLFDSIGLKPEDIKGVEDLPKIPITTKSTLQDLSVGEKLAAGFDKDKCIEISTSGSTGIPLKLYFSKQDKDRMRLFILRAYMENGRKYFDKVATIAGVHYEEKFWFQRLGFMRRIFIPADKDPGTQISILKKFDPDQIIGLPSALKRIAEVLIDSNATGIKPRLITTGAEILDEDTRKLISSGFEANVIDAYGAYECGNIAWECNVHSGYHVNIDSLVVEILKGTRKAHPGEMGEVIITNLDAYAMPIIRYRLGDLCVATDERCPCGRGLPLIKMIAGRSDDFIVLPSGRGIQPLVFRRVMRSIAGVKQFKVIQETEREIVVKIVKGRGFSEESVPQVAEKIRQELELGVRVNVEVVDGIELEQSGKLRSVVSKVKSDFK